MASHGSECAQCRQKVVLRDAKFRAFFSSGGRISEITWHLSCVDEAEFMKLLSKEKHFSLDEHPPGCGGCDA